MNGQRNPGEDDLPDIDLAKFDSDFAEAPVEEKKEFDSVPDGKYQVNVDKVEITTAKTSGNAMLKWTLRILAPRHQNRLLWRNNVMATRENIKWLKNDLHLCGLDLQKLSELPANLERLLDVKLEVEGYGTIGIDIGYGGMFYAMTDATKLGFEIAPHEARDLAVLGERIRLAARAQYAVVHPENEAISGVSIVQLHSPFTAPGGESRNTCIVAPGRSDRSPTGTGLSARLAVLAARGLLKVGDRYDPTSIIGSRYEGRIVVRKNGTYRWYVWPLWPGNRRGTAAIVQARMVIASGV